jgi:hypothetical protein
MPFPSVLDRVKPCPLARRTVHDLHARRRILDIRLARNFFVLEHNLHFLAEGCGSMGEFGERLGYSASETRIYCRAGRVLLLFPESAGYLLLGKVTLEALSILDRVLRDPALLREGDDWFRWAEVESARDLRDRVKKRLEEARVDAPTVEVVLHLSGKGKDDLDRCRDLYSDRAGRAVSESETVERLAHDHLEARDPRRKAPGTRRVGDTVENRSRWIPAEVQRAVRDRARGKCEVPYCDATRDFEFAHVKDHHREGSREVDNILHLCAWHHRLYDAGWLDVLVGVGFPPLISFRENPGRRWDPEAIRRGEDTTIRPGRARRRTTVPPHERPWRWRHLAEDWVFRREVPARAPP